MAMKRFIPWVLIVSCLFTLSSCSLWERVSFADGAFPSAYEQMLRALEAGEKEVTVRQKTLSEHLLKDAYSRIRQERPDLFWLGGSWTGTIESSFLGDTAVLTVSYYGEKQDNLAKRERLMQRAQELAEACRALPSTYDQLLLVHDAIVNFCQYDAEAARQVTREPGTDQVLLASTAYGCLVEGKAICSGYSAAFSLVLQQLSIPCRCITGTADGQLHGWNLVRVGEDWCHVDVTWDDPITEDGSPALVHDYFCIPDEEILIDHLPDSGQDLPDCRFSEYDWYRRNNMTVESCDPDLLVRILAPQIREGRPSYFVKFTEDAAANVYRLTDGEFLARLQKELNVTLKSYRVNSLNNAVELFPAA